MVVFGLVVDDDDDTVDPSRPPSRNVIIENSAEVDDDIDFFFEDEELLFPRIRRARETISPYSADVADDRDSGTRAQGQDVIMTRSKPYDNARTDEHLSLRRASTFVAVRSGTHVLDYASLAGANHDAYGIRSGGGERESRNSGD
jgi:hypothetical protein